MISRTEIEEPLPLHPGKEKDRFEVMEPAPAAFYKGSLAEGKTSPTAIGGTWYPKPLDKPINLKSTDVVMLHLHGGAMVVGDGRTSSLGFFSSTMLKFGGFTAVFAPQYRLASRPSSQPFPAALQDTLTSYLYLVQTLGIPASNITVSGDSAGGNLVIGFLRYLAEYGAELKIPLPRNAVLISPWVDMKASLGPPLTYTSNPHFKTDWLPHSLVAWGASAYVGDAPADDPYISPVGNPFATPVPMFVTVGTAETLEIEDTRWAKEMMSVEGNDVQLNYEPNAPHDTPLIGNVLGFTESAQKVAVLIGAFARNTGSG